MADYTLKQLADEAGVTTRTVRYYISQGLLPSPGAGPGSRYSDSYLERLRVIRQMQKQHLPLAEIRKQIDRGSALEYVQKLIRGDTTPTPAMAAAPRAMFAIPVPAAPARLVGPPAGPPPPPQQPDRSQWDRVSLSADVELHIRRPLTRDQNRRVDRLIATARELLEEDQP